MGLLFGDNSEDVYERYLSLQPEILSAFFYLQTTVYFQATLFSWLQMIDWKQRNLPFPEIFRKSFQCLNEEDGEVSFSPLASLADGMKTGITLERIEKEYKGLGASKYFRSVQTGTEVENRDMHQRSTSDKLAAVRAKYREALLRVCNLSAESEGPEIYNLDGQNFVEAQRPLHPSKSADWVTILPVDRKDFLDSVCRVLEKNDAKCFENFLTVL